MNNNMYQTYCSGCGLCGSVAGVQFHTDEKGYNVPDLSSTDAMVLGHICPAGGAASKKMSGSIWGDAQAVYYGWATDTEIREKASSGGILTAVCCYLLRTKLVSGIIQTSCDDDIPYATKTVISRTEEDVRKCMGSRYSVSAPLTRLKEMLVPGECYAFVGKPCDVSALRMYMEDNEETKQMIKYLLSFFCAGQPSTPAQKQLLKELNCTESNKCVSLQYRGNGWPGFATAVTEDGGKSQLSYSESWGKILGRDVRRICRVCFDGIGEFADISCGDAWYLTPGGNPDFSEHQGRNVVFARTQAGHDLLKQAMNEKYIFVSPYDSYISELKQSQKYQFERRSAMKAMLLGLRLCGRSVPKYEKRVLNAFSNNMKSVERVRRFLGIIKRVLQGKL